MVTSVLDGRGLARLEKLDHARALLLQGVYTVGVWSTHVLYVPRLWRREFFCIVRFIFSLFWSFLRVRVKLRWISVYGRSAISFMRLSISMVVTSFGYLFFCLRSCKTLV
jgi:hypothetical protein